MKKLSYLLLALLVTSLAGAVDLGYSTQGASLRQINQTGRCSVFTAASSSSSLTSLTAYIEDSATGDTFVGAIYDATVLTAATLVVATATRTNISTAGAYTFTFSSGAITSGVNYCILVGSDSVASANVYHDTGTGYSIASFTPGAPNTPTNLSATADTRLISAFITYTTAGGSVVCAPVGRGCGGAAARPVN
jgi:hypothetical protein